MECGKKLKQQIILGKCWLPRLSCRLDLGKGTEDKTGSFCFPVFSISQGCYKEGQQIGSLDSRDALFYSLMGRSLRPSCRRIVPSERCKGAWSRPLPQGGRLLVDSGRFLAPPGIPGLVQAPLPSAFILIWHLPWCRPDSVSKFPPFIRTPVIEGHLNNLILT